MEDELAFVRGKINIPSYIKNNLASARWHKVSCAYDEFEIDNKLNRTVKYVVKLLKGVTELPENKRLLSDILFLLDDVSDERITRADCERIKVNPFFGDMLTILDYCKLFLGNSITYSYKNEFKVFAFLLPMEYIFEDFVFGFISEHLGNMDGIRNLKCQKSDLYLASLYENNTLINDNVFNLKHDIYFEHNQRNIIIDTKYKITYGSRNAKGSKYGVRESDLYQIISYAVRRSATEVFLIYPDTLQHRGADGDTSIMFQVRDELAGQVIKIYMLRIPVICQGFPIYDKTKSLKDNFLKSEAILKSRLVTGLDLK